MRMCGEYKLYIRSADAFANPPDGQKIVAKLAEEVVSGRINKRIQRA